MSKSLTNTVIISVSLAVLTALGIGIAWVMQILETQAALELLARAEAIVAMLFVAGVVLSFLVRTGETEES